MLLNKYIRTLPLLIALLPCAAHAEDPTSAATVACEKTWMASVDNTADEVTYRDFGQKYCDCTARQPLGTKATSKDTAAICMTRTVLYLTMDDIGADEGLSNLTEDKINASCNNIWSIVNRGADAMSKQKNTKICTCAAPKLNALAKDKENYTDREWYAKINEIAAGC